VAIVTREQAIAGTQLTHARAAADFLAHKFTNVELYEFMSRVLSGVYGYFLQQATALARLAQNQLAFERQEVMGRCPTGVASPALPGCCRTSTSSTSTPLKPISAS
jgi:hypothetical protein